MSSICGSASWTNQWSTSPLTGCSSRNFLRIVVFPTPNKLSKVPLEGWTTITCVTKESQFARPQLSSRFLIFGGGSFLNFTSSTPHCWELMRLFLSLQEKTSVWRFSWNWIFPLLQREHFLLSANHYSNMRERTILMENQTELETVSPSWMKCSKIWQPVTFRKIFFWSIINFLGDPNLNPEVSENWDKVQIEIKKQLHISDSPPGSSSQPSPTPDSVPSTTPTPTPSPSVSTTEKKETDAGSEQIEQPIIKKKPFNFRLWSYLEKTHGNGIVFFQHREKQGEEAKKKIKRKIKIKKKGKGKKTKNKKYFDSILFIFFLSWYSLFNDCWFVCMGRMSRWNNSNLAYQSMWRWEKEKQTARKKKKQKKRNRQKKK